MTDASRTTLLGCTLFLSVTGVAAEAESTGVIIASVVAGVLFLLLIFGVAIFCFYKKGSLGGNQDTKRPRKKKHQVFVANGYHASPPPHRYEKRQAYNSNGYVQPVPMLQPPPPAYIETTHMPPGPVSYPTYHGPPPEMRREKESNPKAGTVSGPPTIFIPYNGSMTIRADPRPVVHKTSKTREVRSGSQERHRSASRHRSPTRQQSRPPPQEFVVQQSYDGVPVIRPVIYIDDDNDRERHRSKSRENRYKKKTPSPGGAKITEITDGNTKGNNIPEKTDVVIEPQPPSRSKTPPRSPVLLRPHSPEPKQDERSRASSVTEAVNALRMSVRDDLDDSVSTTSHDSSNAPSFAWTKSHHHHGDDRRAPDPVAGDVLFFPAGTVPDTTPSVHEPKQETKNEAIYSYTKVIQRSSKNRAPSPPPMPDSPIPTLGPRPHVNFGYEVPASLRKSTNGTREESNVYETEHGRDSGDYNRLGTTMPNRPQDTGDYNRLGISMSDRLQNLVEDGDKTRYTHYNLGAMNFGDEDATKEEPVQFRVRRPDTPPLDIPNESHYAQVIKRPRTPPNDIPLVSPRESTEVPPLNLRSTINSPREPSYSYRPSTPPKDFPITPQSSILRPRPATPPTDFPMTPKATSFSPRPPTPPYDAQETARSTAVDSNTGEVSSFKARQRLIEAHLLKNISPGGPSNSSPAPKPSVPKPAWNPAPPPPQAPVVKITPGVIPPAPPPPPPPPAPK